MDMVTPRQMAELLTLVAKSNIDRRGMQRLIEKGQFSKLLQEYTSSSSQGITYKVEVGGWESFRKMIEATGCRVIDGRNHDITENNFPFEVHDPKEVELTTVHFGRDMSTHKVLKELEGRNLRHGTFTELCALAKAHPDLQREFPIIALGSKWKNQGGYDCCIVLAEHNDRREMRIGSKGVNGWDADYHFLAVSKDS